MGQVVGKNSGIYMKGLFSGLPFWGAMLGFSSQWALGNRAAEPAPGEEQVSGELDPTPEQIEVDDVANLLDTIGEVFPEVSELIADEASLYEEFIQLEAGDKILFEYQDDVPTRIMVHHSKYEQMRIELVPEPSVIVDTLPLDAKSIVYSVPASQLLTPSEELLDVLDLEPNLLAVIDNEIDIIKELKDSDNIEILAIGRYKNDSLEYLEQVLSLRINQEEESTLLFQYLSKDGPIWYSENLSPCNFPFIQTPTDHILVSSDYGVVRGEKIHKGIDFAAETGTPIYAAAAGVVSQAKWGTGYGLMVKIHHEHIGGYDSLYAHMSRRYVREGQYVRQGELIGLIGSTGKSTGPHLHYEIHVNRHKVNPRGRALANKFKTIPKVDSLVLEDYRDTIDKIFVQASIETIDLAELVAQK